MSAPRYVSDVREFACADQVVCVELVVGDEIERLHMPLRVFRMASVRSVRFLAEHDASGQVVPIVTTPCGALPNIPVVEI